ncbi:MAG: hypothetical protein LBL15_05730 [Oscillospiraceae bacterium]|jgi:hypothetical protein|nr:hypothetical protein [Oscillospiraceae bacterium]
MKRKITLTVGAVFLVGMAVFTVIARNNYRTGLPVVELGLPFADKFIYDFKEYGAAHITDASEGGAYTVTVHISNDSLAGDFPFYRGDAVDLTFPNEQNSTPQQGIVQNLIYTADGIDVVVEFSNEGVQEGDGVIVAMHKKSGEYSPCLPRSAVHYDAENLPYVYLVAESPGPWGREYTVARRQVSVLLDDGDKVALAGALDKPVVLSSSAPLQDGQSVRFYP